MPKTFVVMALLVACLAAGCKGQEESSSNSVNLKATPKYPPPTAAGSGGAPAPAASSKAQPQ